MRVLRLGRDGEGKPGWLLDGEPAEVSRLHDGIGGGGVWISDLPQFDIQVLRNDGSLRFAVPTIGEAPDWYQRLESGPYGLVDWSDDQLVRSHPLLNQERIRRSPGAAAWLWLWNLRRVLSIAYSNGDDLVSCLLLLDDVEFGFRITEEGNREKRAEYSAEVDRLLHNFLAAAKTRVDLQRRLVTSRAVAASGWPPDELEDQRSALIADGLVPFVHELRNYTLHGRLPDARYVATFPAGKPQIRFLLPTNELLLDGSWTAGTRKWLSDQGETVELRKVAAQYTDAIAAYDDWLTRAFADRFKGQIDQYGTDLADHRARFGR